MLVAVGVSLGIVLSMLLKPASKMDEEVREHRHAKIRYLADQLADEFSDVGRPVSARQVLDMLETLWPMECRMELGRVKE